MSERERYVQVARHAGRRHSGPLVEALQRLTEDPDEIIRVLGTHRLIRLILNATSAEDLSRALAPALAERFESWRAKPWPSNAALLRTFDELQRHLAAAGVNVLLLKGFPLAVRLYGSLEGRPQHDIDLLVRQNDRRRASAVLRTHGCVRLGYDAHAVTFALATIKLDVHRCLRGAPAFHLEERPIWDEAVDLTIDGVRCRTLSDEWTIVLIALSIFEELAHGSTQLRALVDLYLLLRDVDARVDWDRFFARRDAARLAGVFANVLMLVIELFEVRDELPHLVSMLAAWRSAIVPLTADERLTLVFAPPRTPANLRWFARIYPGSLARYLAAFWWAGFPANVRDVSVRRLISGGRVAWQMRVARAPHSAGGA
ncbi:MAG: nucleotidyltransferase family protein [Acidobacteria bacterium]|nr:nucleotidyltransferase family protein [Acidobacteriota bacterium]